MVCKLRRLIGLTTATVGGDIPRGGRGRGPPHRKDFTPYVVASTTREVPSNDGGSERKRQVGYWTHICPLCNAPRVDWVCTRCLGCEDCCGCGDSRNSIVSRQGKEGAATVHSAVTERQRRRTSTGDGGEKDNKAGSGTGSESGIRDSRQLSFDSWVRA